MANPIDIPQNFSTTLNVGGGIDSSQTTGIVLTSVTNLPTDGGMLCFDWASTLDTATAEYIEYTGISGNTLTGVTRGQEGLSAKAHSNGCTIVGVVSRAHIKRVRDKLTGNDATAIQDPNGNEILKTSYVASAVNEFTATNAATGTPPELSATGGDTNVDLALKPKGTGAVVIKGTADTAAELRLSEDTDNGTNYVGFKAPASLGSNLTFTLPSADGSSGQFLKTDGSGVLSFASSTSTASVVDEDDAGSSSTSSSTFADITGADVAITLTATSHIVLMATVSAYQNSGSTVPYGIQWHDGTNLIGVEIRSELITGNARTCTTIQTIAQSKAAGSYTYTVRHRSQNNSASITAEAINLIAFSIPA